MMVFKGPAFASALKRTYISCILHPKSGFSKTRFDINIFRLKLSDTISHQKTHSWTNRTPYELQAE